jgi:hypothetical protein
VRSGQVSNLRLDNGDVAGPQQKKERRGHGVQTGIPAPPEAAQGRESNTSAFAFAR